MNKRFTILFLTLIFVLSISVLARQVDSTCKDIAPGSEQSWQPAQKPVPVARVRFYNLNYYMEVAYGSGKYADVEKLANENLELAKTYRCNWNYGNAIHESNTFLGLISVKNGDVDKAAEFLLKSAQSNGSPALDTFGPRFDLANELLKRGKRKEVIAYLWEIQSFWEMNNGVIDKWIESIDKGETPFLDRHASNLPGIGEVILGWLFIFWPIIVTTTILYWRRKRIARKWSFAVVSVFAVYLMDAALGALIAVGIPFLVNVLEVNKLLSAMYAVFGLAVLLAPVVVLLISIPFLAPKSLSHIKGP